MVFKEKKEMKSARVLIMTVTFISIAMSVEPEKRSLLGDLTWRNIGQQTWEDVLVLLRVWQGIPILIM